jgi:hypothetical protein
MDRHNDGLISRNEWRGSRQSFDAYDWNNDGVLSGQEMYDAMARSGRPVETAPTSGDFIRVPSTRRWTDTGFTVRAGETVTFDAQGTVRLGSSRNDVAGPAGASSGRRAEDSPLPNQAAGALIARIGDSSPMFVGSRRSVRVPFDGRLYLGVNDDYLGDNAGDFEVSVTVQSR